jgi:phytol kinase
MDTQDIIGLAIVYGIIVVSLAFSLINEKLGWGLDTRKIVHIGIGNFVFVWWMFSAQWIMLAFFAVPFEIVLILAAFGDNPVSRSKLGELSKDKGHKTGLIFYVFSIIVLIVFFFDHWVAASIGIVAMTYGDGFGSVVGRKYGKHKTINGKSLEGSIGVFMASMIMAFVVIGFYTFICSNGYYAGDYETSIPFWILPPVVGLITAVTEMVCPGEYDNIFIPLLTAGTAVLMGL